MPHVQTNDVQTYYEEKGSGPPLILVHGGFLDRRMWERQVDDLAAHWRVIAYDIRGHGETGPSQRPHYSMPLLADDLKALLDELDIEHAMVCGLSLGGMIAQTFASRYPRRVEALVLVSTFACTDLALRDRMIRYMLFPKWAVRLILSTFSVGQLVDFSFWAARQARTGEDWREEDDKAQEYVREAMYQMNAEEYWKIYEAIHDFREKNLDAISAPTLVLCGGHEPHAMFRHAGRLDERIDHTHLGTVGEAGHLAPIESPDAFKRLLLSFLRKAERV